MVVNNWWVVVDMTASYSSVPAWIVRLFFISFWIVIVLVMVNIIIAIVLEIHGSLAPEVEKKFKEADITMRLHAMLQEDDRLSMRKRLRDAKKVI